MSEDRITSATLLANGPAIEAALLETGKFPACSFGCHLNVIEFEPLSKSAAALLLKNGCMSRPLVETSAHRPKFMRAVYEECNTQVSKLRTAGVQVSHLDSHQHVHTLPWLFPVVKAVQRRWDIRAVRSSRNIYAARETISPNLRRKKALYNWALRNVYATRTTDGMTDLEAVMEMKPEQARGFHWIEIMVHPGAGDDAESRILRTEWLKALSFPARLASYNELLAAQTAP